MPAFLELLGRTAGDPHHHQVVCRDLAIDPLEDQQADVDADRLDRHVPGVAIEIRNVERKVRIIIRHRSPNILVLLPSESQSIRSPRSSEGMAARRLAQ